MIRRMTTVLAAAALAGAAALPLAGVGAQQGTPLVEGWNVVGSTNQTTAEFVEEKNAISDCEVMAIWRFNPDQTWSAWFSNAPEMDEVKQLSRPFGYMVYCG
jgi:hypothetical protein